MTSLLLIIAITRHLQISSFNNSSTTILSFFSSQMTDNEDLGETISDANEWEVPKTAENDEGREATSRGNDWEVVSLTASAYAAAPGPRGDESIHEASDSTVSDNDAAETSQALFLSGHFVFPPSQHENLPIVPEKLENPKGAKEADLVSEVGQLKDGKHENIDENWGIEGLNVKELSTFGQEYDEPIGRLELNVDEKEDVYGATKLRSLHSATVISAVGNLVEASNNVIDPSYLASHAPKSVKKDEDDDSELPCGAWWKRGVVSLCAHAKETRSFWSIVVAAAVMGLVVLGQRWQQEKRQILHQNWQLTVGDEKSVRILSRLKDVIIGGSRHTNYVTAASAEL